MNNFIDGEELIGRGIAKVMLEGNRVFITFTDGTWTSLVASCLGCYYNVRISFDEDRTGG